MLEAIIVTGLTIVAFIFSMICPISNAALEAIINAIPVAIPTIYMWYRTPRNYLKLMCLKSINIRYTISAKLSECCLSEENFVELNKSLLAIDDLDNGEVLQKSMGEYLYKSLINVNTANVEIAYALEDDELFIKVEDKIKYKLFFDFSKQLFEKLRLFFANTKSCCYNHDTSRVNVKIDFIESTKKDKTADCKNPFIEKLFEGFRNKIVSFKYVTSNRTSVIISNDTIEFIGNDIEKIDDDINNELKVFRFKN